MAVHDQSAVARRRRIDVTTRRARRALLHMRREGGFHHRWTLGDRGSFEIDGDLLEVDPAPRGDSAVTHVDGRMWNPAGTTMARIHLEIRSAPDHGTEIAIAPASALPEWFRRADHRHWQRLAAAACDEVCEEILFYARRDDQESLAHSP